MDEEGDEKGGEKEAKPIFRIDPFRQPGLSLFALNLGAISTLGLVREKLGDGFIGAPHTAAAAFAMGIAFAAYAIFCQAVDYKLGFDRDFGRTKKRRATIVAGGIPPGESPPLRSDARAATPIAGAVPPRTARTSGPSGLADNSRGPIESPSAAAGGGTATGAAPSTPLVNTLEVLKLAFGALGMVVVAALPLFLLPRRLGSAVLEIILATLCAAAIIGALVKAVRHSRGDGQNRPAPLAPLYEASEILSLMAFVIAIIIASFSVAAFEVKNTGKPDPPPDEPKTPPAGLAAPVIVVQTFRAQASATSQAPPPPPPDPKIVYRDRVVYRTVYRTRWRTIAPSSYCVPRAPLCPAAPNLCPAPAAR